jgi:hypothetical protein
MLFSQTQAISELSPTLMDKSTDPSSTKGTVLCDFALQNSLDDADIADDGEGEPLVTYVGEIIQFFEYESLPGAREGLPGLREMFAEIRWFPEPERDDYGILVVNTSHHLEVDLVVPVQKLKSRVFLLPCDMVYDNQLLLEEAGLNHESAFALELARGLYTANPTLFDPN